MSFPEASTTTNAERQVRAIADEQRFQKIQESPGDAEQHAMQKRVEISNQNLDEEVSDILEQDDSIPVEEILCKFMASTASEYVGSVANDFIGKGLRGAESWAIGRGFKSANDKVEENITNLKEERC